MKTELLRRAFGVSSFTASEAGELWQIRSPYSTLNRLKQAGVIESVGRGRYRITRGDEPLRVGARLEREAIRSLRARREDELAELAKRRWRSWQDTGFVRRIGPRRFEVTVREGGGGALVRRVP